MTAAAMHKWTPADDARLVELTAKGLSAREIAHELACGSRNAVIGRQHRLRIKTRARELMIANGERDKQTVARLSAQGLSMVAISRQTGWSYSRVVKLHADAGLQPAVDAQREASRQVNRLRRAYDVAARQEALGPGPFAAAFAEGFRGQVAKADLLDLRPSVCRFPIDRAAGGVGYCGSATHGTSVYCLDHHALCTRRRETH